MVIYKNIFNKTLTTSVLWIVTAINMLYIIYTPTPTHTHTHTYTHTFILGDKSSSFHTILCYIRRIVNCLSSCGQTSE